LFLLEKGADFGIKNKQGKIAAEDAYERGYYEISEIIVEKEIALNKNKIKVEEVNKDEDDKNKDGDDNNDDDDDIIMLEDDKTNK
jgi:hypothetical protein